MYVVPQNNRSNTEHDTYAQITALFVPSPGRELPHGYPTSRAASPHASMSTGAFPAFHMAGRSSFTWQDIGNALGHNLGSYASHVSLSPPTDSRSLKGASPPRAILSAEQRELKRQRDQARRDSKISQRQRRADSSSSSCVHSPPATMADLTTGASGPSICTSAPSHMSTLSEPASVAPQSYMPSYTTPLKAQSDMFSHLYSLPIGYSSGYQSTTSSSLPSHYGSPSMRPANMTYQPVVTTGGQGSQEVSHVRVVQSRPKPQCWEHGCNGRQFSTFSNLLRHQREKSGHAAKANCPNCGAEFTRTTSRNGHLLHGKCKAKRANPTNT